MGLRASNESPRFHKARGRSAENYFILQLEIDFFGYASADNFFQHVVC